MRRTDREVTKTEEIAEIFHRAKIARIGFVDNGEVYIVPVNYGYEMTESGVRLYFHGAKAGRKYDLALDKPRVGFELDVDYALVEGALACNYGARYASIIGNGTLSLVDDEAEAIHGLEVLMDAAAGPGNWEFDPAVLARTAVFRLEVDTYFCKARRA